MSLAGLRVFSNRLPAAVIGACCASTLSSRRPITTRLDYWEHDRRDFDIYIKKPTVEDLPLLMQKFQEGKEVWPWIWCQPNENGPHHVFVGSLADSVLQQIQELLQNPSNNVLIITTSEELSRVSSSMVERCGIVTDASVSLINAKDKILMLDDERVIAFDHLVTNDK